MSDKYAEAVRAIMDICDNESHEESIIRRGIDYLREAFSSVQVEDESARGLIPSGDGQLGW